jgi:protein involved in polysaccharide export with SLBB domain
VRVIGAVAFEARVLYTPGHSINDYVAQAGGYTAAADRGRVSITYPNGERATGRGHGRRQTRVTPGSVIVVPARAEQGERINWGDVVTKGVSVLASVLTLLVALDRLSQ